MADSLPPLEMDFTTSGAPIVIVEDDEAASMVEALNLAPALRDPKWLRAYARVANHFATGDEYELILEPEEFKAKYMERYNAEDPDEEVGPGVVRLHNFGIPDFSAIHPPMKDGDTVVFFAENLFMGIPYKVTMANGEDPQYDPVAMVK